MKKDYSGLKSVVAKMIDKFGRPVLLLRNSRVSSDTSSPWSGAAIADDEVNVVAVYVPLTGQQAVMETHSQLMGGVSRSKNCFLIAGVDGEDIRTYQKVRDDDKIWRIVDVNVVQPGDTVLAYEIEVDG